MVTFDTILDLNDINVEQEARDGYGWICVRMEGYEERSTPAINTGSTNIRNLFKIQKQVSKLQETIVNILKLV